MKTEDMVDFMSSAYVKKEDMRNEKNEHEIDFEDLLYQVIEQRFGLKKKVKQKCEEFLVALHEHAGRAALS